MAKATKKTKPVRRGKLIVLDGTDGAGKATQTDMLVETLQEQGYEVEVADFPKYGSKSAGPLEEYLAGKYGQLNPSASSIFYAVDRLDASAQLHAWLDEGKIVVSNRYVTANAGHQGGKIADRAERLKFFKWLNNLEYNIFGIPKPDLNVILHVPAKVGQARTLKQNKKDLLSTDLKHLQAAEKSYLEIATLFPNTRLVECTNGKQMLTPQEVHNQVWEYVRRIALKDFAPEQ
nr:Thymidylate kinase [uncultured bacterium]AIA16344.1 Thymidylate kinase [uncultured bacterium]